MKVKNLEWVKLEGALPFITDTVQSNQTCMLHRYYLVKANRNYLVM